MPSERILVRGVNWLGDAVMSTPALLRLREARKDAEIVLLTPRKLVGLWDNHPALDAVLAFSEEESVFQVARRLRTERFSKALILPNSPRSALEAFFAGIPERIGYARPWRSLFLTQRIAPRAGEVPMRKRSAREIRSLIRPSGQTQPTSIPASAHHLHQYLHLAAALGANPDPLPPRLVVQSSEIEEVRKKFGTHSPNRTQPRWFGLNPGAHYGPAKRWPSERFIETAVELQKRTQCQWLIFGGEDEREFAEQMASAIGRPAPLARPGAEAGFSPVMNLAGRTTLRELCALLRACSVLVTNDSGPMHVAAAVGTPVVVPFGSTSPELTGPGLPEDAGSPHVLIRSQAPCAPCFLRACPIDLRCLRDISVTQVVEATLQATGRAWA